MGKLFGTDGIRGIANKELTPFLAFNIAKASIYVLEKQIGRKPVILIGRDTRISGNMIESAMVSGFTSVGANVKLLGVIPTPAVSFLIRKYKADAGVVITASHNTFEFNGIKYFSSKGMKLPDEIENQIEEEYYQNCKMIGPEINEKIGTCTTILEAHQDYENFAISTGMSINFNKKMKICVDCSNGATSNYAEDIFIKLGFETIVINNSPNGININRDCGSLHLEELQNVVVSQHLDIGIAFDGDGDRMLAVDNKGHIIDGDMIMALCSKAMKESGKLKNNTLVVTIMSNLGLINFAKENDINIIQTKVGDKYVLEELIFGDYSFGGEQSGHLIFKDFNITGDGIISAIQFLSIISNSEKTVSELLKIMQIYPQIIINAKVDNDHKYDYVEDIQVAELIRKTENQLGNDGRVVVRPSGTEPYVRVMIEGKDVNDITQKANEIVKLIEKGNK